MMRLVTIYMNDTLLKLQIWDEWVDQPIQVHNREMNEQTQI